MLSCEQEHLISIKKMNTQNNPKNYDNHIPS